ncbi:MAG TPA: hypothetical protein VK590_07855 [Saprospiraceae bacterium]|nr:hypothetical protein [Saprospiraceae bacterium]
MKNKNENPNHTEKPSVNKVPKELPGYPIYPPNEDIYNKYKEEEEIDPENINRLKTPTTEVKEGRWNEKNFGEDVSGDDLDIPGSDLDDEQEEIGNEDEENNYYSIGGDRHDDLEENKNE